MQNGCAYEHIILFNYEYIYTHSKRWKNDITQAWISGSVVKSVHMALAEECSPYQTCGVSHYHQ